MAVTYIPFVFPGVPQVRCAFQTRPGGILESPWADDVAKSPWAGGNIGYGVGDNTAHVLANRENLRTSLGLDSLVDTNQVHGVTTIMEPDPTIGADSNPKNADGMATSRPGLGLMIKTADCQPILFTHESGRFVAGIHAGWQGNRQSYPQVAVRELCKHYSVKPESLLAVRGPSLGPACSEFINFSSEWGPDFARWYDSKDHTVNLWQLARDQLLEAGLVAARIFSLDLCTASLDLFYSYRKNKVTGRQGSVIWIIK